MNGESRWNRTLDSTALWVLTGGESVTNQESSQCNLDFRNPSTSNQCNRKQAVQRMLSSEEEVQLRQSRKGSIARERMKRASVEGVDTLLRQTEAKVTKQNCNKSGAESESPLSVEIPMDVDVPG